MDGIAEIDFILEYFAAARNSGGQRTPVMKKS